MKSIQKPIEKETAASRRISGIGYASSSGKSYGQRQEQRRWKIVNRKFEDRFEGDVLRALEQSRQQIIESIRQHGAEQTARSLNTSLLMGPVASAVKRLYRVVGSYWAVKQSQKQRQPERKNSDEWASRINQILERFLTEKVMFKASETTRRDLLRVMQKGIEEGLGIEDMIRRLESYPGLKYQATRIVRTEVNRAANVGVHVAGETFRYEQNKKWVAITSDRRTRGIDAEDHADHYHMNGQTVGFEQKFIDPRNGDELEFPGDPKASAASTINCRCQMVLIARRDSRGRLIPRKSNTVLIRPGMFINTGRLITV